MESSEADGSAALRFTGPRPPPVCENRLPLETGYPKRSASSPLSAAGGSLGGNVGDEIPRAAGKATPQCPSGILGVPCGGRNTADTARKA